MGKDRIILFQLSQDIGVVLGNEPFHVVLAGSNRLGVRDIKADSPIFGEFAQIDELL